MRKKIGSNLIAEIPDGVSEADLEIIFAESPDREFRDGLSTKNTSTDQVHLELPRPLPENLDLTDAIVFVAESARNAKVFIVDLSDLSLYHVVNFSRHKDQSPSMGQNGYAAVGGKIYFLGGFYNDHDQEGSYFDALSEIRKLHGLDEFEECDDNLLAEASEKAAEIRARHLEVYAYNLKTRTFETQVPKLNAPKPWPLVFVYGGKIYAHRGPSLGIRYAEIVRFEFLDPSSNTGLTWTKLPDPPSSCVPVMLNRHKGTLLAIHSLPGSDNEVFAEFDLTSHKWGPRTDTSFDDVRPLISLDIFEFEGSVVGNFFFFYESMNTTENSPSIVVYDLRGKGVKGGPYCKISLAKALEGHVIHQPTYGFLNHLGNFQFSLVFFYYVPSFVSTLAVSTLSLQLQCDVAARREVANEPKQPKIEKPVFTLGDSHCRTFQLPNDLSIFFCKKMEEGYESQQWKPSSN